MRKVNFPSLQVGADRLAHRAGVAEHAEQVVLELEGLAHRGAVARQAGERRRRRAGQQAAELDRPLGRVAARLQAQHPQQLLLGPARPVAAPLGHQQLQVLAADHLLAHGGEAARRAPGTARRPGRDLGHGGDQLDRPGVGEVAEQDGDRAAEVLRRRRGSPARRWASRKRTCAAGWPRRISAWSMMSSWISR